ncbi:DUF2510 domain-containing protein [Microbacterium sp. No. 7]|uniref:DUF2510 domain-containing protein n=1 Tax=Microbacterium sp. No. 7 TaxID=1714373 RepID=UPI0006D19A8E|nr:DUF2510 domain-containing protein [Microbacterium sp. No. 7]ALJ21332.1 hypothetical protein AOA12_16060 [Microbacterium sp. No. 7]
MSTPAGWYDDGHGTQRWWDGTQWTEHVQPAAAPTPPAPAAPTPAEPVAPAASTPPYAAAATPPYAATAPYAPSYQTAPAYAAAPPAPAPASNRWVLWVVGGIVALMIVGGALFFIVSTIVATTIQDESPFSQPGPDAPITVPTEAPDEETSEDGPVFLELTEAERAEAERVVHRYDAAWLNADCAEYLAVTTEDFRWDVEGDECEAFRADAANSRQMLTDYVIVIDDAYRDGDYVLVVTTETGTLLVGDDGEPLAEPEPVEYGFFYELVEQDGVLLIDYLSGY